MRLLSDRSRRRALAVVAAVSLTCGLSIAPQVALAEDEVSQETIEQEGNISNENDEQEVVAATSSTNEVVAPESLPADVTSTVDEGTTVDNTSDVQPAITGEGENNEAIASDENPTSDNSEGNTEDTTDTNTTDAVATDETVQEDAADSTDGAGIIVADPSQGDSSSNLTTQSPEEHQIVSNGAYVIESSITTEDKLGVAGLVLDASGGAKEGAQVITWAFYNDGKHDNQKWIVLRDGETDWYTIASYTDSSLVLTATNDKGKLYLTSYVSGLASQLWAFVLSGTSYGTGYQIVPKGIQSSLDDATIVSDLPNKVVDVSGGKPVKGSEAITFTKSDTVKANQSFLLVEPTPATVSGGIEDMEGKYRLTVPDTSVVVEVKQASTDNKANVWTWTGNGKAHQDVYLQYENNGFYSVWIMGTKKVLDVQNGSILPGTNIIQWSYSSGKTNQQWALRKNADGTYSLINRATGLVLGGASESDGKYGSGTNIIGAQDNGRTNNAFKLVRSALISSGIYKLVNSSTGTVVDVKGASTSSGASIGFYKDNGNKNQRFELISAGSTDLWRIRTASSGGWVTLNSSNQVVQDGNHATAQSNANTWRVFWRNGEYQFKNVGQSRYLGGSTVKYKLTKSPITVNNGLYEINLSTVKVSLDNPKGSTAAGTKYIVYSTNHGTNQKYLIEKYGSGYKITNLTSGLVLGLSGDSITQQKFTGASSQVWTLGIADGGAIRFINSSNKKVLDVAGSGTVSSSGSTSVVAAANSGDRESHQAWKLVATDGWYTRNGHWYFASVNGSNAFESDINKSGTSLGHYDVLHDIWLRIQDQTSKTKYLIATSWDSCYVGVFTGKTGNWTPYLGFNCGNGSSSVIEGKVRQENPSSTWKWNPHWNRLLAVNNVPSKRPELPPENSWARNLGTTWASSRVRKVNAGEQYFTSVNWTLGFHTTITKNPKNELGKHVSNGCIRLAYKNAQWIYDHIGVGTRCIQMRTKAY